MYNVTLSSGEFTGEIPVKDGVNISAGGLFGLDANGYAVNIAATGVVKVVGRAENDADNTSGAAGDLTVVGRRAALHLDNSAATPLTGADFGKMVYAEDAQTVRGDQSDAEAEAGIFLGFDSAGLVIVKL